jgi:hypothetical protein
MTTGVLGGLDLNMRQAEVCGLVIRHRDIHHRRLRLPLAMPAHGRGKGRLGAQHQAQHESAAESAMTSTEYHKYLILNDF